MFASVRVMAACAAAAMGLALASAPAGAFTTAKNYHIMPTHSYMEKLKKDRTRARGPDEVLRRIRFHER